MYYVFNEQNDQVLKYFETADLAYQWILKQDSKTQETLFINKAD